MTIQAPLDYFETPFWPDDYKMIYTHKGNLFTCADTIPFTIRELPKPRPVDVVINGGKGACEGMNAEITIENTQDGVNYYLELDENKTDLFVGNGATQSKDIGPPGKCYIFCYRRTGRMSCLVGLFYF